MARYDTLTDRLLADDADRRRFALAELNPEWRALHDALPASRAELLASYLRLLWVAYGRGAVRQYTAVVLPPEAADVARDPYVLYRVLDGLHSRASRGLVPA